MKNPKSLLWGMVAWHLTPFLILFAIGFVNPVFGREANAADLTYWCVLEHRERFGGYEATKAVKEREFRLKEGELNVMTLDNHSASIEAVNGALTLTVSGPNQISSTAVAELPIERLQTTLYTLDGHNSERFVLSCERQGIDSL